MRGSWRAAVAAGKYTARLVVTGAGVTRYYRAPLSVNVPTPKATPTPTPVPAAPAAVTTATGSKLFPVQGPYTFGGPDARFGVGRPGHTHQGQDITAAEGTPVVTPIAGTVHWTAYQEGGAGYYVVIAGADGRHYVFMHLQQGSIAVTKGAPVTAGQTGRPGRQHRVEHRPAPALRALGQRLVGLQGLNADRPAPRATGVGCVASRPSAPRSRPSTAAR